MRRTRRHLPQAAGPGTPQLWQLSGPGGGGHNTINYYLITKLHNSSTAGRIETGSGDFFTAPSAAIRTGEPTWMVSCCADNGPRVMRHGPVSYTAPDAMGLNSSLNAGSQLLRNILYRDGHD